MRASSIALLLGLAGCAATTSSAYVYTPAVQAGARVNGYPAAHYAVPTERPTGDVRVGSFGLTAVRPQSGGPTTTVAHVRLIVANNADDSPWTVDTRDTSMSLATEGSSRPAFVNSDAGAPPIIQIARGEQRTIDLYYPLPPSRSAENVLPSFDVTWRVRTASGDVVQRTPFERIIIDDNDAYAYYYAYPYGYYGGLGYALGFGSVWWYDAHYPWYGFHHRPAFVVGHGHLSHYPFHVVRPHGSFYGHYRGGHYTAGHYRGGHYSGGHHGGGHHGGGH